MNFLKYNLLNFGNRLRFPQPNVSAHHFRCSNTGLTEEEANFFCENGYLVKTNSISKELIQHCLNIGWSQCPSSFVRDVPESWNLKKEEGFRQRLLKEGGKLTFDIERNSYIRHLFWHNANIQSTVTGLMGTERTPDEALSTKSLYFTFPIALRKPFGLQQLERPYIHIDDPIIRPPFVLRGLFYLSDVEPGGGGFHAWPGSHLRMRHLYPKSIGGEPYLSPREHWKSIYDLGFQAPAKEIVAPAGTLILWHHRLVHARGINRSKRVRQVFLADFVSRDIAYRQTVATPNDPWKYWAIAPTKNQSRLGVRQRK